MLRAAAAVLVERGLALADDALHYNVVIPISDTLLANAYCANGRFFHIRGSEAVSLEREFASHCAAAASLGRFAARPIGRFLRDGWDLLISEGVAAHPLNALRLTRPAKRDNLQNELTKLFTLPSRIVEEPPSRTHRALLDRLDNRFSATEFAKFAGDPLMRAAPGLLDSIKPRLQHGDFAIENLVWSDAGLHVFDYEDFGKVSVPGFDLTILLCSVVRFDTPTIRSWMTENDDVMRSQFPWLEPCLQAEDLTLQAWKSLIALHLLAFLWLKDNYARPVRERVASVLRAITA